MGRGFPSSFLLKAVWLGGDRESDVIGIIVATADGAVFQQQGYMSDEAARFLVGYREAAALVGFGVRMLPVILTGVWSFPGTEQLGEEKRCLVGLHDGSGNDDIYRSVLQYYPMALDSDDEVVVSFIAVDNFQHCPVEEAFDTGRLAACFDIAAWAVDSLPYRPSTGIYDLTKHDVKALSLGVWVNILATWLSRIGIFSNEFLEKIRLVICRFVIEKLACIKKGATANVEAYIKEQPGIMARLVDMMRHCSDERLSYLPMDPEALCRAILVRSLRFFQAEGEENGKEGQ